MFGNIYLTGSQRITLICIFAWKLPAKIVLDSFDVSKSWFILGDDLYYNFHLVSTGTQSVTNHCSFFSKIYNHSISFSFRSLWLTINLLDRGIRPNFLALLNLFSNIFNTIFNIFFYIYKSDTQNCLKKFQTSTV